MLLIECLVKILHKYAQINAIDHRQFPKSVEDFLTSAYTTEFAQVGIFSAPDKTTDVLKYFIRALNPLVGEMEHFCAPSQCYKMYGYSDNAIYCAAHQPPCMV